MGLLKTAATVAVASSVHGRIQRRQQARWAAQNQAPADVPAPPPPAQYAAPARAAPGKIAVPLSRCYGWCEEIVSFAIPGT